MGVLLIIVVGTILCMLDVISGYVVLFLIMGSLIWMFIGMGLYFRFGFLKTYYHGMLGWHIPDDSPQYFDGCSQHARCKHCGKDIMQDSQGNWF